VTGIAVVGQLLGSRLVGRPTVAAAIWGIAAQVTVMIALGLLSPLAGLLLFYGLGTLGLGGMLLHTRGLDPESA
jgi:hypothetical protein